MKIKSFVIRKKEHWYIFKYNVLHEKRAVQTLFEYARNNEYNVSAEEAVTLACSLGYDSAEF